MAQDNEWNIKRSKGVCAVSGEAFGDGDAIVSRVVPGEEGLEREDFSPAAWSDELKEGAISFWQSVYREPVVEEKVETFGLERAEQMLVELSAEPTTENGPLRYVLALMLERKRLLVEREVQRALDEPVRIYEHKKSGDVFVVPDPQVNLQEFDALQLELAKAIGWRDPAGDGSEEAEVEQGEG